MRCSGSGLGFVGSVGGQEGASGLGARGRGGWLKGLDRTCREPRTRRPRRVGSAQAQHCRLHLVPLDLGKDRRTLTASKVLQAIRPQTGASWSPRCSRSQQSGRRTRARRPRDCDPNAITLATLRAAQPTGGCGKGGSAGRSSHLPRSPPTGHPPDTAAEEVAPVVRATPPYPHTPDPPWTS